MAYNIALMVEMKQDAVCYSLIAFVCLLLLLLLLLAPPIISTEPVSIMNAHHGSSPSLMCVAEGTPTPTITWLKNLLPLTPDPRLVVVSEEGMGVLLIKNATLLDEGQYSCVATNPLGTSVTSRNRTNLRISNSN